MTPEANMAKKLPRLSHRMPYATLFGAGIRPTFYGFVFLGMLAALLLGSINHNNNLGYLLTFLLSGLLLASIRATWRNVRGVSVEACRADPACRSRHSGDNLSRRRGPAPVPDAPTAPQK